MLAVNAIYVLARWRHRVRIGVFKRRSIGRYQDLVRARVLEVTPGPRGKLLVAADDAWVLELYAEVRRAGFTRDLGFDSRLLRIYERSVAALFEREKKILTDRLAKLPPDRVAPMLEKAIPLVHQFFARYHSKKVRDFFARMGD